MPDVKHLVSKVKNLNFKSLKGKFTLGNYKPYYFVFLFLLLAVSLYHLFFAKRLIPGVYVAGLNLGGLTYNQAIEKLQQYEKINEENLDFSYAGKQYELKASDINLEYNWEATVNRAFEVGRTGNFFVDTKDKVAGVFKNLYIPAYYDFNEEKFNTFLDQVKGELSSPAENAQYFVKNNSSLGINSSKEGLKLDNQDLYNNLVSSFDEFNFGTKALKVEKDEPQITQDVLSANLEKANKIVFNPIKITYEKEKWQPTPDQKLSFLTFDLNENSLAFNKAAFRTYLETITPKVNKLPKGEVTKEDNGRVQEFQLIQDGIELDVDQTSEAFKEAFFGIKDKVPVMVKTISGPVDPKSYGIIALLGEGDSKFTGSAQGRINNLTLAAKRTSGVLVPPGATYSFNDAVGEISGATGYDSAWIILGNRTVLGHGGGVCQTSTTLFRAILNAGLPVVERHPHAYRVHYYEIDSPIGIDASVYQPSLDLKFKNDTANYVLVQSSWNLEENSLTFKLYGTPDGRKVEISDPVVTNQRPALPAEYQDDPTLAKGVVKQVDFAAPGANIYFTRTVTKDGKVLYDDTFKTNYQPWRAIFLVGTKEV